MNMTIEEMKLNIAECEKVYHDSFKTGSCASIMNSWYALQNAKKEYYKAVSKREDKEDKSDIEVTDDD